MAQGNTRRDADGIDIVCVPSFVEIMIDDQERTAVRLSVEKRSVGLGEAPPSDASAAEEETGFEF
ncbi:MAG: stage V sporulation protein S [Chloroflexota bacterium]